MIKLLLNPHTQPQPMAFDHSPVVIGYGGNKEAVDLCIDNSLLEENHVKIFEDEIGFVILNCTNDPFVTVNGCPFYKRKLQPGELIQIHDTIIKFDGEHQQVNRIKDNNELAIALDKKIADKTITVHFPDEEKISQEVSDLETKLEEISEEELAPEEVEAFVSEMEEAEGLAADSMQEEDLDSAIFEVDWNGDVQLTPSSDSQDTLKQKTEENNQPTKLAHDAPPIEETIVPAKKNRGGLKEFHLSDLEEENILLKNLTNMHASDAKQRSWKWWFFILGILFILIFICCGVAYFKINEKTSVEEFKASQGISDIAMALTHAQIYHLVPHNQNWSDSDFLKANLMSVLASKYPPATDIDNNRQFSCCNYSLRIYTSSDLSHFILIAQPAPSILQWLIPKGAILVDSNFMEIRKIKDLRILNRLLANPDRLEGANGLEIANLIRNGELIRLSTLAIETEHLEFSPPKALAWIRPGAENLIYNAPRYYKFGQPIMQKAVEISVTASNSQSVSLFKQEISALSNLRNLVLYCSQGKKTASQVRKGLKIFAANQDFLIGFLSFNSKGQIANSQLLRDEGMDSHRQETQSESIAMLDILEPRGTPETVHNEAAVAHGTELELDGNDPLYIHLSSMANQRNKTLAPLAEKLTSLLTSHSEKPVPNFQEHYQEFYEQYITAVNEQDQKICKDLPGLCQEYADIPAAHIIIFAKATGLESYLTKISDSQSEKYLSPSEKMKFLQDIDNAADIKKLESAVIAASGIFTLEFVRDPTQLVEDQNSLRNKTINKLQEFLFSPTLHLPKEQISVANKDVLVNILKHAWIIDPEERDFFLAEWERQEK